MTMLRSMVVGWFVCLPLAGRAQGSGPLIDLTAFDAAAAGTMAVRDAAWGDVSPEPVGPRAADFGGPDRVGPDRGEPDRRFYISGMLGPSFLSLHATDGIASVTAHDAPLAAGGAVGVAFERPNGRLRIETEGMGRGTSFGPIGSFGPLTAGLQTASNWSVLENVWRDVMLTDRLGLYGGGGIGAGGYRAGIGLRTPFGSVAFFEPAQAGFAWQAGGGVIYEITERLTFDISYRYFQINAIGYPAAGGGPFGGASTTFGASELMFGLRLYEPLQRWRR